MIVVPPGVLFLARAGGSAEHPWPCPQFIRLAQTLKYYGYLKFDPCVTDFPEKGCHVVVSAGNNELNFQVRLPNEQIKEGSFKVTRMRCWRVTSSVSDTWRAGRGLGGCARLGWHLFLGKVLALMPASGLLAWRGSESCLGAEGIVGVRTPEGT